MRRCGGPPRRRFRVARASSFEIVERQFRFLDQRTGLEFFLQLGPTLDRPSIRSANRRSVDDCQREASKAVHQFDLRHSQLLDEMKGVREDLTTAIASLDDSDAARPDLTSSAWGSYFATLANFDALAIEPVTWKFPCDCRSTKDPSQVPALAAILRGKLEEAAASIPAAASRSCHTDWCVRGGTLAVPTRLCCVTT
jgi:hypothetical protein